MTPKKLLKHYKKSKLRCTHFPCGEKHPTRNNWQLQPTPFKHWKNSTDNIGLLHQLSGTCSYDFDYLDRCTDATAEDIMKAGLCYTSGKTDRMKVLFRVPKHQLSQIKSFKLYDLPTGRHIGEFITKMDVLPPSVVKDKKTGKEYTYHWIDDPPKSYTDIPELPKNVVKAFVKHSNKELRPIPIYATVYNEWAAEQGLTIPAEIERTGQYIDLGDNRYRREGSTKAQAIISGIYGWYNFSSTEGPGLLRQGCFDLFDCLVTNNYKGNYEKARKAVCNGSIHSELKDRIDIAKDLEIKDKKGILGDDSNPVLTSPKTVSLEDIVNKFKPKQEVLDKQVDSVVLIDGVVRSGQVAVLCAPSGSGKTVTLFYYLCPKAVKDEGTTVIYIDADSSASDWQLMKDFADKTGITYLNPHTASENSDELFNYLKVLDGDLKNHLFVIDTMKRFTDMMQKNSIKSFLEVMGRLTALGASVVVVAHTNKHPNKDEELEYEGTNDLENNCDSLTYLYYDKNEETGIQDISFYPDKTRAILNKRTIKMKIVKKLHSKNVDDLMSDSKKFIDIKEFNKVFRAAGDTKTKASVKDIKNHLVSILLHNGQKMGKEELVVKATIVGSRKIKAFLKQYKNQWFRETVGKHGKLFVEML